MFITHTILPTCMILCKSFVFHFLKQPDGLCIQGVILLSPCLLQYGTYLLTSLPVNRTYFQCHRSPQLMEAQVHQTYQSKHFQPQADN